MNEKLAGAQQRMHSHIRYWAPARNGGRLRVPLFEVLPFMLAVERETERTTTTLGGRRRMGVIFSGTPEKMASHWFLRQTNQRRLASD